MCLPPMSEALRRRIFLAETLAGPARLAEAEIPAFELAAMGVPEAAENDIAPAESAEAAERRIRALEAEERMMAYA